MARSGNRFLVPVLAALAGLGLVVVVWMLRRALAPFFMAMVLAYLLGPAVAFLSRRMKRGAAVAIVGLSALAGLVLAAWLLIPRLLDQLEHLVSSLPVWKAALEARWGPWFAAHPWALDKIRQGMEGLDPMLLLRGILGAGAGLLGMFLEAMTLLLVPIIVYYLLMEGDRFLEGLEGLVPPRFRPRIRRLVGDIHQRLGGYIRGQLGVAAAMALLQGLAFQVVGMPYAWLLGLVAGISNIVPYSPYLTALLPGLVMAGLAGAGWGRLAGIALLFTAVQKAETLYFTPVWVGRASRLHPLEVLLAILCFGFAFGLIGLIFAVPLMIALKVAAESLVADYKRHPWFADPGAEGREP